MTLNINKFISVSTLLAFQASKIIRDVYGSKDIGKIMKGVDDPVTEADYKIQTLIINGLRSYWPTIKIVGEQQSDYKGEITYDYNKLNKPIFAQQAFTKIESQLSLEHACVWIDPLDGTLSYTKGQLDQVTTLIGLSYKRKARLGIVGIPYVLKQKQYVFDPKVLVADGKDKIIYEVDQNSYKILQMKPQKGLRIATSKNRVTSDQYELIQKISSNIYQCGGSGKKIVMMVYGQVDCMIYLATRTSRWDICAGEALLNAFGGKITSVYGDEIEYDQENKDYLNYGGLVCSFDDKVHKEILKSTISYKL